MHAGHSLSQALPSARRTRVLGRPIPQDLLPHQRLAPIGAHHQAGGGRRAPARKVQRDAARPLLQPLKRCLLVQHARRQRLRQRRLHLVPGRNDDGAAMLANVLRWQR